MGSCVGTFCEDIDLMKSNVSVPEMESVEHYPGFTRCQGSCSFWPCGCGLVGTSCIFYRPHAVPASNTVYELISCPTWEQRIGVEILLEGVTNATLSTRETLIPGITHRWRNVSFTPVAISQPPVPVLGKRFLFDGKSMAMAGEVKSELFCPDKSSAEEFNCSIPSTACPRCTADHVEEKVFCQCKEAVLEGRMANPEEVLPMNVGRLIIDHKGRDIFTETSYSPVQVMIKFEGLRLALQHDLTKCHGTGENVTGCYNCNSGAVLNFGCRADFGSAMAEVNCGDGTYFTARCDEKGGIENISLAFNMAEVHTNCTIKCPGGDSNFSIIGHLRYIPLKFREELGMAKTEEKMPEPGEEWWPKLDLDFDIKDVLGFFIGVNLVMVATILGVGGIALFLFFKLNPVFRAWRIIGRAFLVLALLDARHFCLAGGPLATDTVNRHLVLNLPPSPSKNWPIPKLEKLLFTNWSQKMSEIGPSAELGKMSFPNGVFRSDLVWPSLMSAPAGTVHAMNRPAGIGNCLAKRRRLNVGVMVAPMNKSELIPDWLAKGGSLMGCLVNKQPRGNEWKESAESAEKGGRNWAMNGSCLNEGGLSSQFHSSPFHFSTSKQIPSNLFLKPSTRMAMFPLLNFMAQGARKRQGDLVEWLGSDSGSEWGLKVLTKLKDSEVGIETTHLTEAQVVQVVGLTTWGADVERVRFRGPTLDDYYRTKHHVRLNFPSCPCAIEEETGSKFPLELLAIRLSPGARRYLLKWAWDMARPTQQEDADGALVDEMGAVGVGGRKIRPFSVRGIGQGLGRLRLDGPSGGRGGAAADPYDWPIGAAREWNSGMSRNLSRKVLAAFHPTYSQLGQYGKVEGSATVRIKVGAGRFRELNVYLALVGVLLMIMGAEGSWGMCGKGGRNVGSVLAGDAALKLPLPIVPAFHLFPKFVPMISAQISHSMASQLPEGDLPKEILGAEDATEAGQPGLIDGVAQSSEVNAPDIGQIAKDIKKTHGHKRTMEEALAARDKKVNAMMVSTDAKIAKIQKQANEQYELMEHAFASLSDKLDGSIAALLAQQQEKKKEEEHEHGRGHGHGQDLVDPNADNKSELKDGVPPPPPEISHVIHQINHMVEHLRELAAGWGPESQVRVLLRSLQHSLVGGRSELALMDNAQPSASGVSARPTGGGGGHVKRGGFGKRGRQW
jgi:hypothetical protein